MVYLQAGNVEILSRNRHVFTAFKDLQAWLVENLRVRNASFHNLLQRLRRRFPLGLSLHHYYRSFALTQRAETRGE